MPILIQRMIFNFAPQNAPLSIRPVVKTVFEQLKTLLVIPEIKKNLTMVCGWYPFFIEDFLFISIFVSVFRLKRILKNQNRFSLRADKSQLSVVSN